jgi:hypothetical protein
MKGTSLLLVGLVALSVSTTSADPITLPSGLAPGSYYQLIFVTSDGTLGTSANIADYNTFVNSELSPALTALSTTWTAIASTATVNAIDNAPVFAGVPVYNMDGQEVFTGSDGLYPMYSDTGFLNAPEFDENGTDDPGIPVWTGSQPSGLGYPMVTMGAGFGLSIIGLDTPPQNPSPGFWITDLYAPEALGMYSVYGLSGEIEVPAAPENGVPEPGTFGLLLAGVNALLLGKGIRTVCGRQR